LTLRLYNMMPALLTLLLMLSGCELMQTAFPGSETDTPPVKDTSIDQGTTDGIEDGKAPVIIAPTTNEDELLQIMHYSRIMQSYPRARLKDEFKRAATALADNPDTANQLRMAILLSIPNTSFKNEKRAMQMLSRIVNDGKQSSKLQEYAYLLLDTLQQRGEVMQINKELSEELQAERQKRVQLQQKLDALKSIEKSISQRQIQNEAEKQ
jgi:hypothetical protein